MHANAGSCESSVEGLTAPAVPQGLDGLRHLIYVTLPGVPVATDVTDAMVHNIRAMTNLHTLSLPTLPRVKKGDDCETTCLPPDCCLILSVITS